MLGERQQRLGDDSNASPGFEVPEANAFGHVAQYYDMLMAGVPYDYWVDYIEQLWSRHGLLPLSVLDVGCGTGAVAIELRRRGYEPVGVDISASMLDFARRNAAAKGAPVRFEVQDAAELSLPGQRFDAIVSLFDSLNNIVEPDRLQMAFRQAYEHLASPGLFIFDVNAEFAFKAGMFRQRSTDADGPLQYVWKPVYDPQTKLCVIEMTFRYTPTDGRPASMFSETHVQRWYETGDVIEMLQRAGFGPVWVYDGYTFKPARKRSDRLFFVAAKDMPEVKPLKAGTFNLRAKRDTLG
jgi:ubiquinone/menaquinone biosynthesis C-methylase UbiE